MALSVVWGIRVPMRNPVALPARRDPRTLPGVTFIRPFHLALLAAVLGVLAWSGVAPHDRLTWWLEVSPTIAGLVVLAVTWRRFRLTDLALTLIALHMTLLCVGGKYTYALSRWHDARLAKCPPSP